MPQSTIELSVIVVSWNTREILRDCLRSAVYDGNTCQLEAIVIDNASTDGSADMVTIEFPHVRLIRNIENVGFAAANNQVIRASNGKYILLLNSDTVILDDVLQRSVKYLDSHPGVGVMGCRVLNADHTLQPTCFQYPTILNLVLKATGLFRLSWPRFFGRENYVGWNRDTERDVDVVTGCYMMVRREALSQVGLMDESFFFFGEETDWCKRFKDAGWGVRFSPVGEIIHYGGASAAKLSYKRDLLLTQGLIRYHRKHGGIISAIVAFVILWFFNMSRWLLWSVARLVRRGDNVIARQRHFRLVVREFATAWPRTHAA